MTDASHDLSQALAEFARLWASTGWLEAIQHVAARAARWPPRTRLALFVEMAKAFKSDFAGKGVDTELLRAQIARKLIELITDCDAEPGKDAGRVLIVLARTAREYERMIGFGQDLAARFPDQAAHADQAIGWAYFNLKRPAEALEHLNRVPADARSTSTVNMLARLSASTSVDAARAPLEAGFRLADAGDAPGARQQFAAAMAIAHPELGAGAMARTFAVLAGEEAGAAPPVAPVDHLVPLFCAGFRWSGASAIYDFLADYAEVAMFPRRPRFMQDSPGAMEDVRAAFGGAPGAVSQAVRAFVAQQVMGVMPEGASAAQSLKGLENSILRQFPGGDLAGFDYRLAVFLEAMRRETGKDAAARAFPASELAGAVRAMSGLSAPAGTRLVLFDSVIRAAGAALLETIPGARMVAVFRDPRDMYVTHVERGSWSKGVERYISELKALYSAYETAMASPQVAAACKAVRFEAFVTDPAVRRDLAAWLGLEADPVRGPDARFAPEKSALNIGVHRAFPDQDAIAALEKAFPERCGVTDEPARGAAPAPAPAPPAPPPPAPKAAGRELDVLTLSVMATRRQQRDQMGLAGLPGEPGWARRREIDVNLFLGGGYDFIGLQHCHTGPDEKYDAAGYFRRRMAERGVEYGVINRAATDKAESDSTPLYYRLDRWEMDPADHGALPFVTPEPPEDAPGGGGLLFLWGLFHEKAAGGGRTGRSVYVYNVRLRNRHTPELDVYRAKCFLEMDRHMQARATPSAPVVVLGDMNTKEIDCLNDRVMRGLEVSFEGAQHRIATPLQDTLLALHPEFHGKVRSQHDFDRPGDTAGSDRNDRVLATADLAVLEAEIVTYNEGGLFPSYHYPVRARLAFGA